MTKTTEPQPPTDQSRLGLVPIDTRPPQAATELVVPAEDPYKGASVKHLTNDQVAVLTEKLDPEQDVEILPTGEVYMTQVKYRDRLTRAFRPGGWALVPLGQPEVKDQTILRHYRLVVEGRFISEAIGEAEYIPANQRMTWATAAESAKSNALMRCCKDLGIGAELWDKRFIDDWKSKHAVEVDTLEYNRKFRRWRRADAAPLKGEQRVVSGPTAAAASRSRQEPRGEAEPGQGREEPREQAAAGSGAQGEAVAQDGRDHELLQGLLALWPELQEPIGEDAAREMLHKMLECWPANLRDKILWLASKFPDKDKPDQWRGIQTLDQLTRTKNDGSYMISDKWAKSTADKLRDRIKTELIKEGLLDRTVGGGGPEPEPGDDIPY